MLNKVFKLSDIEIKPAARKRFQQVTFLVLTLILILIVVHSSTAVETEKLTCDISMTNFLLIIFCSIFYILSKSCALFFSAQAAQIKLTYKQSITIFTRSALIEITLFPAKIAGDTFKYFALPAAKKIQKISCLLIFRVTSFIPFLLLALFLIQSVPVGGVVLLVLAGTWFAKTKFNASIALIPLLFTTSGHFFALLSWVLQGYLVFILIAGDKLELTSFAVIFLTGQVIATISNLPFGLGVKEIYFTAQLHTYLEPTQLILFLLLLRLSGELLTAMTGWCFAATETLKKSSNAHQINPLTADT